MENAATEIYAPSRSTVIIYILTACIALAGLTEATYLAVLTFAGEMAVCGDSPGCSQVLGSAYAKIHGVPVSAFGAAAYFTVFTSATFAAFGYPKARKFLALIISAMFLFTLWLLGVQAFLLHAFCRYCLVSAAMVFLLTGLLVATPPASSRPS
ncbi:MAG TPA: vitamin K epoxide reductase family protein [Chthoniobacterales bacterium]